LSHSQAFETVKHFAQHNIPKTMRPVIASVISELAALGFIGLVIGAVELGGEESWLTQASNFFFGMCIYVCM
jgi:hypothetical protein